MNTHHKQLFKAVQCALEATPFLETIIDQKTFFKLARENGVSGMLYPVFKDSDISAVFKEALYKDYLAYHRQDILQEDVVNTLTELFNTKAISHIFLKGVHLKKLYPEPYMRSMGDIDLLVKVLDYKTARQHLSAHAFTLWAESEQHSNFTHESNIEVELHPKLTRDFNPQIARFLKDPWSHSTQASKQTYTLELEFELIYLLVHTKRHMEDSGIGLRTILDVGLFLKHYINVLSKETIDAYLDETNLSKFFNTLVYLNEHYFGLITFSNTPLKEETTLAITEFILKSGVHGHGASFNPFLSRFSSKRRQGKGRIIVVLAILFPSFTSMKGMYPWLKFLPFLYPLTWLIRWIKLVFLKTRRTFRKIKKLFISDTTIETTKELFKEIGL